MNQQISNNQISLRELLIQSKDWFSYLCSRWKIILLFGITGSVLGVTYSLVSKPVYVATLSFALEDEPKMGLSGALGLASQFGFDLGGSAGGIFSGANLIELFKSRTIVEQTLLNPVVSAGKTVSFADMYVQNAGWKDIFAKNASLSGIQFSSSNRQQFSRVQDSVLGVIYAAIAKNSLKVEQKDKNIDIITIEMQSDNEDFAKYFTEALVKEVSDFYISTKSKKARINMDILAKQTDSIRNELNGAISGVASANDKTFGLNPALNIRRVPSARRQVDVQANTAILIELVKQTELAKVTLRKETPLIQVIDRPILPLKKQKFGKLKGIVLGGFLAAAIIIFFLTIKRGLKRLSLSESA